MFSPYVIILGLFVVAGFGATLWGFRIVAHARQTERWPSVEGVISEVKASSDEFDLLPHIEYQFTVEQKDYQQHFKFSGDVSPTQELAQQYLDKYPVGKKVTVHFNPEDPEQSTLEPGMAKGDWLVLGVGAGMLIFGLILFATAE